MKENLVYHKFFLIIRLRFANEFKWCIPVWNDITSAHVSIA